MELIAKQGKEANYIEGLDDVVEHLAVTLKPGDVLLTVGAGDVYRITDDILQRLSKR